MTHLQTDEPMTAEDRDIRRNDFGVVLATCTPAQVLDLISERELLEELDKLTDEGHQEMCEAREHLLACLRAQPPTVLVREQVWTDGIGRVLMVVDDERTVLCLGDGLIYRAPRPANGQRTSAPDEDWTYLGPTLKLALWAGGIQKIQEGLSLVGAFRSVRANYFKGGGA